MFDDHDNQFHDEEGRCDEGVYQHFQPQQPQKPWIRRILRRAAPTLIIAALLSSALFALGLKLRTPLARPVTKSIVSAPVTIPWPRVNRELGYALDKANDTAGARIEALAADIAHEVESRAINSFLPSYLSWMTMNRLAAIEAWQTAVHFVDGGQPTGKERVQGEIESMFRRQALSPPLLEAQMISAASDIVTAYAAEISRELEAMPERFDIPSPDFERHLRSLSELVRGIPAGRQIPLIWKGVIGAGVLSTIAMPPIRSIASGLASRLSMSVPVRILGTARFFCGALTAAVLAYDIIEYKIVSSRARTSLSKAITDYTVELQKDIARELSACLAGVQNQLLLAIAADQEAAGNGSTLTSTQKGTSE